MRAAVIVGSVLLGAGACASFSGGDVNGPGGDAADGFDGAGGLDAAGSTVDGGDGGGTCSTIADQENVRGPLAPADPAIYWVNGTTNSVRIFENGTAATLFTNDADGGALTTVATAGPYIAWAEDKGARSGGVLHLDLLTAIGKGPAVPGLMPTSMQLFGSSVYGVAEDRTQNNADLFLFQGASTYSTLSPLPLPTGNAVVTSDGWVYAVGNGTMHGLSNTQATATEGPGVSQALGGNGTNAFLILGKQVVKTVGPAIAMVASNIDAVEIAADQASLFYFATPPSTLFRRDDTTTAVTAIADVPAGASHLVAAASYLYYVVDGQRIVRCNKPR